MLTSWVLLPLLLTALAVGWGVLVELASGRRLPAALLPGAGLAVIIVVAGGTTAADATAELTVPVVAAGALAGLAVGFGRRAWPDAWLVAAGAGVFAVYAAPIVLSGEATFAGYIKLDDTATWLTLTDRVMEHGRDLDGLAPSSYEATLDVQPRRRLPGRCLPALRRRIRAARHRRGMADPAVHGVARRGPRAVALGHLPSRARVPGIRARGVPGRPARPPCRLLPVGRDQGGRRRGPDRSRRSPRGRVRGGRAQGGATRCPWRSVPPPCSRS